MELEESELLNINVTVCDRPYRLKVKPEEEEAVRKAAKNISDKVKELQDQFAGKDKQDYLAMTALMLSVEKLGLENNKITSETDISKELNELDIQIIKALRV